MAKVYEYIPSAFKEGATAAIIPNREEASVTRTSDGYSENADGTLELKGANETRYYYDNGVRKILIEDSATNLLSDFSNFDKITISIMLILLLKSLSFILIEGKLEPRELPEKTSLAAFSES